MSVAVAVRGSREIVLATDSLTSFGSRRVTPENHQAIKIRKVGSSLLASTGWGIYENLLDDFLRRGRNVSLRDPGAIFSFYIRFWKALHDRYSLVNEQCSAKDSPFGDLDSSFLVVNANGIFCVESDMSVTEFQQYYAIGSGANYSLGALHALFGEQKEPRALARRAVDSAIALDTNCGGDVAMLTVARRPAKRRRSRS